MAAPPPIYPAELRGGTITGDYIEARMYGQIVHLELRAPYSSRSARPRAEQVSVWLDGECIVRAAGKTGAFAEAAKRLAAPLSRRALATMGQGYGMADLSDDPSHQQHIPT